MPNEAQDIRQHGRTCLCNHFDILCLDLSCDVSTVFPRLRQEVRSLAIYVATGLDIGGEDYLSAVQGVSKTSRITLIAPDGMVLFDSDAEAKAMENHLDRPEVATALRQGYGEASRLSATLGSQTFYYAVKLDDGSILRIANTVDSIYAAVLSFMPTC